MTDIQTADLILEYVSRPVNFNSEFTSEDLQEKLFPSEAMEIVELYLTIIDLHIRSYSPGIAKYSDYYLSANSFTKTFLDQGGLTAIAENEIRNHSKKQEEESLQIEKLNLEVIKLRNDFFDYSETKKRTKQSLLVSKISVFIALTALLITVLKWKYGT